MLMYKSSGQKKLFEPLFRFIQHVLVLTHLSIQSFPFPFGEAFHVCQFFTKNAHTGIGQISNHFSALALTNGKSRSHGKRQQTGKNFSQNPKSPSL